jgi:nitroreductase
MKRYVMNDISVMDAIWRQRAIRRFRSDPVPDEAVTTLIEAATHAPSGGNRQPWRFVVIRDTEAKHRIGEWYHDGWANFQPPLRRGETISEALYDSLKVLAEHIAEAPVLILVCVDRGPRGPQPGPVTQGAGVYPAVQNLLLAAQALGLGTTLTTFHVAHEGEVKELLGIPPTVETAALIPVGYPAEGEHFGGSRRKPPAEVTYYERWGES